MNLEVCFGDGLEKALCTSLRTSESILYRVIYGGEDNGGELGRQGLIQELLYNLDRRRSGPEVGWSSWRWKEGILSGHNLKVEVIVLSMR